MGSSHNIYSRSLLFFLFGFALSSVLFSTSSLRALQNELLNPSDVAYTTSNATAAGPGTQDYFPNSILWKDQQFLLNNTSTTSTTIRDVEIIKEYPPFLVSCFHPRKDHSVLMLDSPNKVIIAWCCSNDGEKKVSAVMHYVFANAPPNSLMLDVGSNKGFYSLFAAQMGHQAIQFDLQPSCLRILLQANALNGFTHNFVVGAGVSDQHGNINVSEAGCDGRFPMVVLEKAENKRPKMEKQMQLRPLSFFIDPHQPVMLMKVDTEGNEARVLKGSMPFFENKSIHNAIVEITPGYNFWKNMGIQKEEVAAMLEQIINYGYVMVSLHEYKIFRTAASAKEYILDPPFGQSDMWFTLDPRILKEADTVLDPRSFFRIP